MGVGSCVSDFVGTWVTWSYSKFWSALPRRHTSSPGLSEAADHDVLAARCRWSPHVIRDSYPGRLLEITVSELEAFLRYRRDANRRGADVQPRLACAGLPWRIIGFVWGYNLAWMIVQDVVKLGIYGI